VTGAGGRARLGRAKRCLGRELGRVGEWLDPAPSADSAEAPVACRFPLGHYYSPLPDSRELAVDPAHARVWPPRPRPTPGIDWNDEQQLRLATEVFAAQQRMDFVRDATVGGMDYWMTNDQYPPLDAWVLEGMLRHLQPARMIEIGSGYSSLVSARVNRELLDGSMTFTCIEPYPRDFLLRGVPGISGLRVEQVQDTPLSVFEELQEGDVLFVDTAHTVKTGGDVAWIFGEILPSRRAHPRRVPAGRLPRGMGARGLGMERDLPDPGVPRLQFGLRDPVRRPVDAVQPPRADRSGLP
jgi:hypothetical protein